MLITSKAIPKESILFVPHPTNLASAITPHKITCLYKMTEQIHDHHHHRQHQRPFIIAIEGNIGAGKTTLFNYLKNYVETHLPVVTRSRFVFMREPVDVWQSICDSLGESILSKFYKNPEKYAFPFQIMAYTTRLSLLQKTINEIPSYKIIICERSLEADKNIFARMLFMESKIEDVNYQIYHHLYNSTGHLYKVDAVIYVDADANICHERIHIRNREGEECIELDYLKRCRNYYNDWLIYGTNTEGKTNIHHLSDYVADHKAKQEHVDPDQTKIDEVVYQKILTERENSPKVLHLNANEHIDYNVEPDNHKWINKIMLFINETCHETA